MAAADLDDVAVHVDDLDLQALDASLLVAPLGERMRGIEHLLGEPRHELVVVVVGGGERSTPSSPFCPSAMVASPGPHGEAIVPNIGPRAQSSVGGAVVGPAGRRVGRDGHAGSA